MEKEQIEGLILIAVGVYTAIRFKYLGETILKQRTGVAKAITLHKVKFPVNKLDIKYAQALTLAGGIFFTLIGIASLFGIMKLR